MSKRSYHFLRELSLQTKRDKLPLLHRKTCFKHNAGLPIEGQSRILFYNIKIVSNHNNDEAKEHFAYAFFIETEPL